MARLPPAVRVALATVALASAGATAEAYWVGPGIGAGSGAVAGMPSGSTPSGSVAGRSVTVSWPQSSFLGARLGTFGGGGYTVRRYPAAGGTALTPGAGCSSLISGATATLQCVESAVDYGSWRYTIKPVLHTFTGAESATSATATVATAAPAVSSVAAENPTAGQTTGSIQLVWAATTGATGYNVYRRTPAGSYSFTTPLNGATPVATTSFSDPGSGLGATTMYDYVVRALAGTPAVESASSNELAATTITRPDAPAGTPTATPAAAAHITVAWSAVASVAGYNVYRRTAAGSFDFGSPLNGASAVTATTFDDATASNGSSYRYAVRAVILGAGAAQVESASSADSGLATADGTAPGQPTALTVNDGGNLLAALTCSVAAGTRFVNNAGKAAVSVTATIPAAGDSVLFSATTPGSTPVTKVVAAGTTTVTTTINLTTLLDGAVTLTARGTDAAGNLSATRAPANVVVKDVVAGALSDITYTNVALLGRDKLNGTSECGALITATETLPLSDVFTVTVGVSGTFTGLLVEAIALGILYSYNVTATDLAGNTSAVIVISGSALL
jgi:hypothetical protein